VVIVVAVPVMAVHVNPTMATSLIGFLVASTVAPLMQLYVVKSNVLTAVAKYSTYRSIKRLRISLKGFGVLTL
jgi:hypothetical protein